jgi:methionyl-tRNA formyltransferase
MRVVFIGCVEFSAAALAPLLRSPDCEIAGVVTRRHSAFNSDFRSLEGMALEAGVPCFPAEGNDQEAMADWIEARRPDVVYCFGWSYLLKARILRAARLGVVGYHPAAIPMNRGRHPVIWALALGLEETASTFFFMDEGADTGDILSQVPVAIAPEDDAGSLYRKLTAAALGQIAGFTPRLKAGTHVRLPQDHSRANSWRKRGKADGQIDWRMPARGVHDLVRALARPYPGAHCLAAGAEVKIWRARPVDGAPRNLEPGKVLSAGPEGILVKCGEGALLILEHEFTAVPAPGSYL